MAEKDVYGTNIRALFATGDLPNMMSKEIRWRLHLVPMDRTRRITVANGKVAQVFGEVTVEPNNFAQMTVHVSYLHMVRAPPELILGAPAMESLGGEMDLRRHLVSFTVGDGSICASSPLPNEGTHEHAYQSNDGTTDQNEIIEEKEGQSGSGLGIVIEDNHAFVDCFICVQEEEVMDEHGESPLLMTMLNKVAPFQDLTEDEKVCCSEGCATKGTVATGPHSIRPVEAGYSAVAGVDISRHLARKGPLRTLVRTACLPPYMQAGAPDVGEEQRGHTG